MHFVIVTKGDKSVPSDATLKTAMINAGGTSVTVSDTDDGSKVSYSGDVTHSTFVSKLRELVSGSKQTSWNYQWGDSSTQRAPLGTPGSVGTAYSIKIENQSQIDDMKAIVFQKQPNLPSDVFTLAWLTKSCHKNTFVSFDWTLNFDFVWGAEGQLMPGVDYQAGGVVPADLTAANQIDLKYVDGGFEFGPVTSNSVSGSLFITEDDSVPGDGNSNQGCVGIGMFNSGTFVMPTQSTGSGGGIQFQVHPEYWIAFGNHEAGEVVDESVLLHPTQVQFGGSEFHADCVFDGTTWTISYS